MDVEAKKNASEKKLNLARKAREPLQAQLDRISGITASLRQQKQKMVSVHHMNLSP